MYSDCIRLKIKFIFLSIYEKFTITLQVSNMASELPFHNLTDYELNFKNIFPIESITS